MILGRILNQKGLANGKLALEFTEILPPEDILKEFPEHKNLLNEIKENGWRYIFIHTYGKSIIEFDISNNPGKIIPYGIWSGEGNFTINIDVGKNVPEPRVKSVNEFRINIAIKNMPRALTIDIAKKTITYIDEVFWNWKDEFTEDEDKRVYAIEIHKALKWLIEEKKFELDKNYPLQKYQELKEKIEKLSNTSNSANPK